MIRGVRGSWYSGEKKLFMISAIFGHMNISWYSGEKKLSGHMNITWYSGELGGVDPSNLV